MPQTEARHWPVSYTHLDVYKRQGEERFKKSAEIQVESFLHRIENKIDVNHHDMGFLFSLSCVAAYKLTGNETAKKMCIRDRI